MIDYHSTLVSALEEILPTHYEMTLHSGLETPCISYMEISNVDELVGDTVGYSRITYRVKVWGNDIGTLQKYAKQIDKKLKPLGWVRTGSQELYDNISSKIQKILTYRGLGYEIYQED